MVDFYLMDGSSRVQTLENNLSAVAAPLATNIAAIAVWSKKGEPFVPTLINTGGDAEITRRFGKPKESYGYGLYGAKYYAQFAPIYIIRAVSGDYKYAGTVFGENYSSGNFISNTFDNTKYIYSEKDKPDDLDKWEEAGVRKELFIAREIGPGDYSDIRVRIISDNFYYVGQAATKTVTKLAVPSPYTTSLDAGTYFYTIVPINRLGAGLNAYVHETALSGIVTTTADNAVKLTWPRNSAAVGYNIYRGTVFDSETHHFVTHVPNVSEAAQIVTYLDANQNKPRESFEDSVGALNEFQPSPYFTLNFYEGSNTVEPIESYECTYYAGADGLGNQTGLQEKINLISQRFRIKRSNAFAFNSDSNPTQLINGVPYFITTPLAHFSAGADGDKASDMDSSAYIKAYRTISSKEKYQSRILIEASKGLNVQTELVSLASLRDDTISLMDIPSDYQEWSNAVNYRELILKSDSDRAAIFCGDVEVFDSDNGERLYVPPSVKYAALLARNDSLYGYYTATANVNRASISDALQVRYVYEQDQLNAMARAQINAVKSKVGVGIYFPDQLTLSKQLTATSFISVRRMIDILKLVITNAYEFLLQDQNDDYLVMELVTLATQVLEPLKTGRGLADYTIEAGTSVNGAAFINNGQRNIKITLAPILPGRFFQVMFNITRQELEITETVI